MPSLFGKTERYRLIFDIATTTNKGSYIDSSNVVEDVTIQDDVDAAVDDVDIESGVINNTGPENVMEKSYVERLRKILVPFVMRRVKSQVGFTVAIDACLIRSSLLAGYARPETENSQD